MPLLLIKSKSWIQADETLGSAGLVLALMDDLHSY